MKKQVIFIHGGETFDTYDNYVEFLESYELDIDKAKEKRWKESLGEDLGSEFQVISPIMPSAYNSKYKEWKIWFEKIFPFLEDDVVIIGHSLSGIFVAKYLAENDFPKKILATYLIAAPFDDKDSDYSLADFALPKDLDRFEKQSDKIFIYQSEDDPVVPFVDLEKYEEALPSAKKVVFKDRGHFMQEEFPELIQDIKSLY